MKRRKFKLPRIKVPKVTNREVSVGALFALGVVAVVYAAKG